MKTNRIYSIIILCLLAAGCTSHKGLDALRENFLSPPNEARPGVIWCFMDGNLSKEGITADLEGMKEAGIGYAMFMEINVGVPRGKVNFWSEEWQSLFVHAVNEARRLGIELTTLTGPGWTGSGGPWVKPEQSMRNLVASDTLVKGQVKFDAVLALPPPYKPPHDYWQLTPELRRQWEAYYKDVCVLAFPTPAGDGTIADLGEKALYYRAPYSSMRGVKHWLPSLAEYQDTPNAAIDRSRVIDLTDKMDAGGRLQWDVPEGKWTIMRFVMRNNGVVSRPAPEPGLGFECDKLDTTHLNAHFNQYLGTLFRKTNKTGEVEKRGGWTMLQIDSWEMNTQNWSDNFRSEFTRRRGYDPLKYLPVYAGKIIDNTEISERFLWDVRQTAMELLVENHALHLRTLGRRYGMTLSIQPYDMNPAADFDLASAADVPGCEFWANGHGYNTVFGCTESASVAHIYGRPIVAAEAFTAHTEEGRTLYPETVKNQGDWAFAAGLTRLVYT
ncbi:MAG: glycosyl hydrolase, partial [Tannerella sp.]|nr:glycosyl hydrolase [Tannerella sp.]